VGRRGGGSSSRPVVDWGETVFGVDEGRAKVDGAAGDKRDGVEGCLKSRGHDRDALAIWLGL